MMNPETAIIVRTKNEEKWLGECLKRLRQQTYRDFEIIVVDSGSTDRTLEIARNFDVRIFKIKPEEFSYPFALNHGCERASAMKYFVILSAHSLPSSRTWLEDGLSNLSESVMGVYGAVWALPDASIWEKILFNRYLSFIRNAWKLGTWQKQVFITHAGTGVLGFTNAVIRKDLWGSHHFDESYGLGGEDGEWARYWFARGYKVVRDIKFSVYHSHGLGLKQLMAQWRYWASLGRPQPYRPLEFRKK